MKMEVLLPIGVYIVLMLMRTSPMLRRIKALEARCLRLEEAEFARLNHKPHTPQSDAKL